MNESAFRGLGGNKIGGAVFLLMTAFVVYMIWMGVTGRPLPHWVLWITTVL